VATYPGASIVSEAKISQSDSQSALPVMGKGVIHVQHSYEVTELSILPQGGKEMTKGINSTYTAPFDERSSREQLVRAN
jgi:hypothetical protein